MPDCTLQQELTRIIRRKRLAGQTAEPLSPWNAACLGQRPQGRIATQTQDCGVPSAAGPRPPVPTAPRPVSAVGMAVTAQPRPGASASVSSPAAVAAPVAADGLQWPDLQAAIAVCTGCPLCNGRKQALPGTGCKKARLMFIGDWPSAEDDAAGVLFSGRAGELLGNIIKAMGFDRNDDGRDKGVYLASLVKCMRPLDRPVGVVEAQTCMGYLKRQIELVQPSVIVTLGGVPLRFLLNLRDPVTKLRGIWQEYNGIPVMPTYHPAFLLRFENQTDSFKAEKRKVWNDMKLVMNYLQTGDKSSS